MSELASEKMSGWMSELVDGMGECTKKKKITSGRASESCIDACMYSKVCETCHACIH